MPIPDDQRHSVAVKLRLPPEAAAELRRRGKGHPRGASGVVAGLLEESEGPCLDAETPRKKTPAA